MPFPRIPSYEEASMAAMAIDCPPMSPMSNIAPLSKKIDQTKLKTKSCRYFLAGAACPFGDICAFSHSEPVSPASYGPYRAAHSSIGVTSEDLSKSASGNNSECQSVDAAGEVPERVVFGQPPPAYDVALKEVEHMMEPDEMATPPAYPKRFRFDPYSANWITFERVM